MPSDPPLDPDLLDRLTAYAAAPRGNRAGRTWTLAEVLTLFDPAVPVTAIMARLGVKRAIVTYELVRLRRAGFPVPGRSGNWARSPRTLAIEGDVRAGMTDAEVAREHGVSPERVWEIRSRAGIPTTRRFWTEQERVILLAHQDRPAREVAALMNRTVRAVETERSKLIIKGRIRPKIVRPQKRAE